MTTTTNAFTPLSNAGMMENPDRTLLTVQMQEISFPRMSENRVGIISSPQRLAHLLPEKHFMERLSPPSIAGITTVLCSPSPTTVAPSPSP